MRIRSGLFVFGFVSLAAAGVLVACGSSSSGDDSSVTGNDAASDVNNAETSTTVTASASDLSVYVGQNAVVQGSATPTSATFAWTVTSVPTGSAITTASLTGATTATPSFTPDVIGDYVLSVTASASGATGTKTATVHALPGKAFIGHQYDAGAGAQALGNILFTSSDGTGQVPIVCPTRGTGLTAIFDSFGGLDWLEGDAGQPAIVAFPYADTDDGGNILSAYLAAGTSDSRCGGPSTIAKLDYQDAGSNSLIPRDVRLSSNGQRIAYLRETGSGLNAATIGFDGSDLRVFGPAFLASDGGPGPSGNDDIVPPTWVDSTQIAWIQLAADSSSWSIKIARDQDNATVDTFMTCNSASSGSGAKVYEFALLPDGTAIVATQPSTFDAGNFVQLLILSPDPTTHVCTFVRSFSAGTGYAADFSVSPDKTQVAFLGSQTGNSGDYSLYVAAISGTTPPKLVPGAPTKSTEGLGPRWAANGHTIIWGQGAITDGGSTQTVFAVPAAGGTAKPIAASADPSESFLSVGNSCSVAFGNASPVAAAFAMLGVFVGLIVRRRRNKK
jgi:hypothetical protein